MHFAFSDITTHYSNDSNQHLKSCSTQLPTLHIRATLLWLKFLFNVRYPIIISQFHLQSCMCNFGVRVTYYFSIWHAIPGIWLRPSDDWALCFALLHFYSSHRWLCCTTLSFFSFFFCWGGSFFFYCFFVLQHQPVLSLWLWEGRVVHYVGQQIRASCWLHIAWQKHTLAHTHTTNFLNPQVLLFLNWRGVSLGPTCNKSGSQTNIT